jgi:hypothetical protein
MSPDYLQRTSFVATIRKRILKIYLKYLATLKTYKRRRGYTKNISNNGVGWMDGCVWWFSRSGRLYSWREGPRCPTDGRLQNPVPFWTSVIMEKTAPTSVLEIRFLQSCQSEQQLLHANEDKSTLITLSIWNASCVKTWVLRCSEVRSQSFHDFDRYTVLYIQWSKGHGWMASLFSDL